jgi:phenylalanyl-tRNA synthetase beta chain
MKVTYNWLKDFVDCTLTPGEAADRLTMAGLEVESAEVKDGDTVFTIEVTSNRPDWLSVQGIARELAAVTGRRLKLPRYGRVAEGKEKAGIVIEDKKDCPLYTARIVRGIRAGQGSGWMRKRLEMVGVRPVNNIVDITNYVLFELGEPLHAFDLDKLTLPIVIRRARKGEKIVAIDGKEYALDPGILVIADASRPVAIAGVMGGKDTEVTGSTRNVLLEAAIFDPVLIRRGRQKLGLQSEASYRFERGIDPCSPETASVRAGQLMKEIAGGELAGASSSGSAKEKARAVILDAGGTAAVLGADIAPAAIKRLLMSLGFAVALKGKKMLSVGVPSFRRDVKAAIDLVEEVARIHGYEAIPSRLPAMAMQPIQKPSPAVIVKETMRGQGLDEVLTYSLADRRSVAGLCRDDELVEVANPLSSEQEILRPMLMPSLARCVAYNLNQRRPNVAIFEVAKTYAKPDRENNVLGIALSGTFSRWFGPQAGNLQYKAGFLNLKGIVDTLLFRLGICVEERAYAYADGNTVLLRVKGIDAGMLKKLSAKGKELFDIKDKDVFLAEIALDRLLPLAPAGKKYKEFPRLPSISRDITLELKKGTAVGAICAAAVAASRGRDLLIEAAFLDRYEKNLPPGIERITITCMYSAKNRTLTEAEISPVHAAVIEKLTSEFCARQA